MMETILQLVQNDSELYSQSAKDLQLIWCHRRVAEPAIKDTYSADSLQDRTTAGCWCRLGPRRVPAKTEPRLAGGSCNTEVSWSMICLMRMPSCLIYFWIGDSCYLLLAKTLIDRLVDWFFFYSLQLFSLLVTVKRACRSNSLSHSATELSQ